MKKISSLILITLLFLTGNALSANFEGGFNLYDPFGVPISPPIPITGIVDFDNDILVVDEFFFLGSPVVTNVLEILGPGTYTRTNNGDTISATIGPDQMGAYMLLSWNANEFPVFMGWEVDSSDTIYTAVDVDGDGIPGMALVSDPFAGFSPVYEFVSEPAGPGVRLVLSVDGGNVQECTTYEGTEVTINAMPELFGGAVLDSISWTIDGADAGTGATINVILSLGDHEVDAVATITTGETGYASTIVTVRDITRPDLQISFINKQGQEVDVAGPGPVEISMTATDICDPEPIISSGTATPTFGVNNGDVLFINKSKGNLKLPTTSLRVDATATDSSGNASSSSAVLAIE